MFNNFSLTWTSIVVAVLIAIMKVAGIDIDDGQITEFVYTGVQLLSAIGILFGRYRQGDINIFGKKV